ncbi:hypothetical protein OL229_06010 [Neisseriaceae bacterium JH1-16]|nr:hypothetical protein [Neisseriaceae bacterium JH1-16]
MFSFMGTVSQDDLSKLKDEMTVKIEFLEKEIRLKATDSEEVARKAAEDATEAKTRAQLIESDLQGALINLKEYAEGSRVELDKITSMRGDLVRRDAELKSSIENTLALYEESLRQKDAVQSAADRITSDIEIIRGILDESQALPGSVDVAKEMLEESKRVGEDIKTLLAHSMKKKGEIDELHKEICGYDVKNDQGESEHIDGLRDDLTGSYNETANKIGALDQEIDKATNVIIEKHENILSVQKSEFKELIDGSREKVESIKDQLAALLPGAMAAGLSAAYEEKKREETELLARHEARFGYAIFVLMGISLIPFGVDAYLLGWRYHDLVQVIKDTPSLIISIFPLYFPALWLAYSASKKINLSKRLIEEYTHKAVLGKTFSGLSNQIESLAHEGVVRDELRTRLLFNVLQVSAENPGKLITDYNKSDHPLMEAIENSSRLSDSIESLEKIPGFSAIAKKLATATDELLERQAKKVEQGLAAKEHLDGDGKLIKEHIEV